MATFSRYWRSVGVRELDGSGCKSHAFRWNFETTENRRRTKAPRHRRRRIITNEKEKNFLKTLDNSLKTCYIDNTTTKTLSHWRQNENLRKQKRQKKRFL